MKYKVLLIGKNKVMIGDFFQYLDLDFEMQSSSMRYNDIMSHIKYFNPHALVFCMSKEEPEHFKIVTALKNGLESHDVVLVLTGDQSECDEFQHGSGDMGDLVLYKPITARSIKEKIIKILDERHVREEQKDTGTKDPIKAVYDMADALLKEMHGESEKTVASAEKPQEPALKHVLVVDDDPMMLKLIKEQLKDSYTVATAINGAIALKFLESKKTDLIILDYEMPNENGGQVLAKIRMNPATAKLPVVFLTGMKDRQKIQKLVELKPQGYLLKPIESEKLIKTIRNIIG